MACYPTAAAAAAAAIAATTVSDNCPGTVSKTASISGDCSATITVTGTDSCGNSASVTYSTRIDSTPPVITCPSAKTVSSIIQPLPASYVLLGTPSVSDNCPGTVTVTNNAPSSYPFGTTIVTWTATDACGNSSTCTQAVTVNPIPAATITVEAALHTVGGPGSLKTPLALTSPGLKVFNLNQVSPPNPASFGTTYNSGPSLSFPTVSISGPTIVSVGGGTANRYTILVPSSASYLVIGRAMVGTSEVYVGSPTDTLATGSLTQKYLQAIQNLANGKTLPAKTTAIPGSLLLIVEPEFIELTSNSEILPIVYESVDGDWSSVVIPDPPPGYINTTGALQTSVVTSQIQALQFTIQDPGNNGMAGSLAGRSFLVANAAGGNATLKLTHRLKHKGKDITVNSTIGLSKRK
jgi:hypothetical protein